MQLKSKIYTLNFLTLFCLQLLSIVSIGQVQLNFKNTQNNSLQSYRGLLAETSAIDINIDMTNVMIFDSFQVDSSHFIFNCDTIIGNIQNSVVLLDINSCTTLDFIDHIIDHNVKGIILYYPENQSPERITLNQYSQQSNFDIPVITISHLLYENIKKGVDTSNLQIQIWYNPAILNHETYDSTVFWGNKLGQGDFGLGLAGGGWTVNSSIEYNEDWEFNKLGIYDHGQLFPGQINSPTSANGTALFKSAYYLLKYLSPVSLPPYPVFVSELISPIIDCTNRSDVLLSFYTDFKGLNNRESNIQISIDGGNTWEKIFLFDYITKDNYLGSPEYSGMVKIPIPQFNDQEKCRVKFEGIQSAYHIFIDDITLSSTKTYCLLRSDVCFTTSDHIEFSENYIENIPLSISFKAVSSDEQTMNAVAKIYKESELVHEQIETIEIKNGFREYNHDFNNTYLTHDGPGLYEIEYFFISDSILFANIDTVFHSSFKILESDRFIISKIPILDTFENHSRLHLQKGAFYDLSKLEDSHKQSRLKSCHFNLLGFDESKPEHKGVITTYLYRWYDLNSDLKVTIEELVLEQAIPLNVNSNGWHSINFIQDGQYSPAIADSEDAVIITHSYERDTSNTLPIIGISSLQNDTYNCNINYYNRNNLPQYTGTGFIIHDNGLVSGNMAELYATYIELTNETTKTYNEVTTNKAIIFPNPTKDFLKIHSSDKSANNIYIYNLTGQLMEKVNMKSGKVEIETRHFPKGYYAYKITFSNGTFLSGSFIKQ